MKKKIAILLAFTLGFAYCPSEIILKAAANEEELVETKEATRDQIDEKTSKAEENEVKEEKKSSFLDNLFSTFLNDKKEDNEKTQVISEKKTELPESSGLKNLQIPQKLNVVIDPWEMDRKGQVYSEEYTISNTGDTPGILTLSGLSCKPREQSGVIVRTDTTGIHDSGDKAIYMEMILGNGERIVFSQESSQYQTELEPGEEMSLHFIGEVNENAFGQWKNNDISVSVVYSWKTQEELEAVSLEVPEDENQANAETSTGDIDEKSQDSTGLEEEISSDLNSEKQPEENIENGISEEQQLGADVNEAEIIPSADNGDSLKENSIGYAAEENTEPEASNPVETGLAEANPIAVINEFSISDSTLNDIGKEKGKIKNVDLCEAQKVDVVIDSWEKDEKGQIVSPQYLLENTGNTTGIWTLSELVCKPREQSKVAIRTDKNELHNSEEKSVYMELIIGNGEKIVLSQEHSQYKVELKPGEKLSVRFVGEMSGNLFEISKDGDIAVTAVCTWDLK